MASTEGAGEAWGGGWGRWQARLALLLALPVLLTGAFSTNYVFLAGPTPYRCAVPECEGYTSAAASPGGAEGEGRAPAWAVGEGGAPAWADWALGEAPCFRPAPLDGGCSPASFDNASLVPCDTFVYGPGSSIVAELGLACQEWRRSLVGTVHNVGMLVSLPIMGYVSDRRGRRAALVVSACGAGVFGLLKSFATSYHMYIAAELLETIFGASVYPAAFVLLIEWLSVKQRIQTSLVLGVPLALGTAGLSLLDYLTGYWRLWARWAYPPSFLLLLYPWLLPESVRWLLARGRTDEAVATIQKAARCNKVDVSQETLNKMLMQQKQQADDAGQEEDGLFRALIRYGELRLRVCVCFLWWFSAVFVFYGLAANTAALAGSLHANYAALAAAQLPALVINTLLLDRAGRRALLTAALLLTSLSLILKSALTQGVPGWVGTALYLLGMTGATMTLNCLYVYTSELFPTCARQRLLAASSAAGRVGSLLAPLTPLLGVHRAWLPTVVFGALPLLSAALTRLLPDTLHAPLPHRFADLAAPATPAAPAPQPSIATIS